MGSPRLAPDTIRNALASREQLNSLGRSPCGDDPKATQAAPKGAALHRHAHGDERSISPSNPAPGGLRKGRCRAASTGIGVSRPLAPGRLVLDKPTRSSHVRRSPGHRRLQQHTATHPARAQLTLYTSGEVTAAPHQRHNDSRQALVLRGLLS